MDINKLIYGGGVAVFAGLIAFVLTPLASLIAHKTKAIDVPNDNRRMHKVPIPLLGGLAIWAAFVVTSLLFCEMNTTLKVVLLGGSVIVLAGFLDDIIDLNFIFKFAFEIGAAFVAVALNVVIDHIDIFSHRIEFGVMSVPITVLWIVGLTNAINLIDGLDGLACGVSAICCLSLMTISFLMGMHEYAMMLAILAGACFGFLPFNHYPARIFMGDTGALFLGYSLAIFSIQGLFKMHAVISFVVPVFLFALPLSDTIFAFVRRLVKRQNPFKADKLHLHHRLMKMGFNQRQTVSILYAISGLLGTTSVMYTRESISKSSLSVVVCVLLLGIYLWILKDPDRRLRAGFDLHVPDSPEKQNETNKDSEDR